MLNNVFNLDIEMVVVQRGEGSHMYIAQLAP